MQATILVVDDDVVTCQVLSQELTQSGYTTHWVTNGNDAIDYILSKPVDIMLLDLRMPDIDGLQVLRELEKTKPRTKTIVLTGYGDFKGAVEATRLGASDFINKPYDLDELLISIRKVLTDSAD